MYAVSSAAPDRIRVHRPLDAAARFLPSGSLHASPRWSMCPVGIWLSATARWPWGRCSRCCRSILRGAPGRAGWPRRRFRRRPDQASLAARSPPSEERASNRQAHWVSRCSGDRGGAFQAATGDLSPGCTFARARCSWTSGASCDWSRRKNSRGSLSCNQNAAFGAPYRPRGPNPWRDGPVLRGRARRRCSALP